MPACTSISDRHTPSGMAEMSVQQAYALAVEHHRAGQFPAAENIYQSILVTHPGHAESLHMLGLIRRQSGDNSAAINLIRRAIAVDSACCDANYNLGNALRDDGQSEEAIAAFRRSILLQQNLPQSYHNLGCLLRDKGQMTEAAAAFEQARQAISPTRKTSPAGQSADVANHWFNVGNALREERQFTHAITAYQRAVAINPDFAEAFCNLGSALVEAKQFDAAITAYRRAIAIKPDLALAHHNLGKVFYDTGDLDQAIASNRQALSLRPDYTSARRNLAGNLFEAGELDEAIAAYRQARSDDPAANTRADSALIYALQFHPASTPRSVAVETDRWNRIHALPLGGSMAKYSNDRTPNRRLRIGYVSPDFRHHVVGLNVVPLFENHDRNQFEIICYADVPAPDERTRWFEQHCDLWRNTTDLPDERLARQIREDRIDILVDLALHTGNRLLVFARKPAPVQVTFAGYPGSTGLTAIDYRLSDPYLDPPGTDESVYSEKTIRLPHSFWCFDPLDCRDIPVSPLPAESNGFITFGCLNNFCKINPLMLDRWASIMRQTEGSRLILLAKLGRHRQRTIDYLGGLGIGPDRVEFLPFSSRRNYLRQFQRVDISLDSFPCTGHTTSLDSLWMGVPVVTLVGETLFSRAGWCQLSNLGLTELASHTPEGFIEIAAGLAKNVSRLRQIRAELRPRMEQSPLMNGSLFARTIEAAYLQMWQTFATS
jgi:predicted O-linked N-acetylglucosamine transferase (SPINDLY family)